MIRGTLLVCWFLALCECNVVVSAWETPLLPTVSPRHANARRCRTLHRWVPKSSITRAVRTLAMSSLSSSELPLPTEATIMATGDSSTSTVTLAPGILKTVTRSGNGEAVQLGDIATLAYSCFVVEPNTNDMDNEKRSTRRAVSRSLRQKMVVGDTAMIAGWDAVVRSMVVGEECLVRLAPNMAYGATGIPPLIPPHAHLELEMSLLDTQRATANIQFDALADSADPTPKTASDIAAAYSVRQALAAQTPELTGWDWAKAKLQSFYFFGLFEGETGQQAPWFLRPSITFPLAFLIVGLTFYVSFVSGAISERGAQTTDELDDIILMSAASLIPYLTTNALALWS
jgi:FKBP-type peptidyl-prolyl cis-trans isomerase